MSTYRILKKNNCRTSIRLNILNSDTIWDFSHSILDTFQKKLEHINFDTKKWIAGMHPCCIYLAWISCQDIKSIVICQIIIMNMKGNRLRHFKLWFINFKWQNLAYDRNDTPHHIIMPADSSIKKIIKRIYKRKQKPQPKKENVIALKWFLGRGNS